MAADCPDVNLIIDYASGAVTGAERDTLDRHVADCELCSRLVGELARAATAEANAATGAALMTTMPSASAPPRPLTAGSLVGRYVILQLVGWGGMGAVYRAYDPELERVVAVKLLRVAGRSGFTQARLLREARALAQLSDPNVIPVHDVGLEGDEVFIAMEYVDGATLRSWLAARKPTLQEIVAVFTAAGNGLAAAHRAGLIHRDFKPENVIIGDDGRIRVLDFGLARRHAGASHELAAELAGLADIDPAAGADIALSAAGAVVGTRKYMAPEQAHGQDVDERADQYSFCVTLAEAVGDMPRPRALQRLLARGSSEDPADRYDSLHQLLTALARIGRVRRNLVIAAALVALLGIGAVGLALLTRDDSRPAPLCVNIDRELAGIWDADVERAMVAFAEGGGDEAIAAADRIAGHLNRYAERWLALRTEACRATHVRGTQPEAVLDRRMQCLDRRRSELRALLGLLREMAVKGTTGGAADAILSLPGVDACSDGNALLEVTPLPADPTRREEIEALFQRLDRANAHFAMSQYQTGRALAGEVVAAARELPYPPLTANALYARARLERRDGDYHSAEKTLRETADAAARAHDDALIARAWIQLTMVLQDQGRLDDSELIITTATAAVARACCDEQLQASLWNAHAILAWNRYRHAEATAHLERALTHVVKLGAAGEAEVGRMLADLAAIKTDERKAGEAQRYSERAIEILARVHGPLHYETLRATHGLAVALFQQGQLDQAEELFTRVLDEGTRLTGADHPAVAQPLYQLGAIHAQRGDYVRARELHERALRLRERSLSDEHPLVAASLDEIAAMDEAEGRIVPARAALERSLAIRRRAYGESHTAVALSHHLLGALAHRRGDLDTALANYQLAYQAWPHSREVTDVGINDFAMGRALWEQGEQPGRAAELVRHAGQLFAAGGEGWRAEQATVEAWLASKKLTVDR